MCKLEEKSIILVNKSIILINRGIKSPTQEYDTPFYHTAEKMGVPLFSTLRLLASNQKGRTAAVGRASPKLTEYI